MPKFIKVNHPVDGVFASAEVNNLEKRIGDAVDPLADKLNNILNLFYPIGTIYRNTNNIDPSKLFGGTWQIYGQGRVSVGYDSSSTIFNESGNIGGEISHKLTIQEIPSHNHGLHFSKNPGKYASPPYGDGGSEWGNSVNTVSNTGGGLAHNNLQPYIVDYAWVRTA